MVSAIVDTYAFWANCEDFDTFQSVVYFGRFSVPSVSRFHLKELAVHASESMHDSRPDPLVAGNSPVDAFSIVFRLVAS
jgi:hypothetical protein